MKRQEYNNLDLNNKFSSNPITHSNNSLEDKEVEKNSEEWNYITFIIKSSLSPDLNLEKIINITNDHSKIRFEKLSEGRTTTYAWTYGHSSIDSNYLLKLKNNGYDIGTNGMDYWVGNITDDTNEEHLIGLESNIIIISRVMLGRSYCKIFKDKQDFINNENILNTLKPPEYDSMLIWPQEKKNFTPLKCFRYRIFESEHVLPLYIVALKSKESSTEKSTRICYECNLLYAKYYCVNCDVELCEEDFNLIHNSDNKLNNINHEKVKIEKNKPGVCACDPSREVEYYCFTCNKSFCGFCKVIGTHSKGHMIINHDIRDINEAWNYFNPDSHKLYKDCISLRTKGVETYGRIFVEARNLKESSYKDAIRILESINQKEKNHIINVSFNFIHSDFISLEYYKHIKNLVAWIDKYFEERELFLKENENKQEFIWIWSYHRNFVEDLMSKAYYAAPEVFTPSLSDYKYIDEEGKFLVNKMRFEDDPNDEIEKGGVSGNRMSIVSKAKIHTSSLKVNKASKKNSIYSTNQILIKSTRARGTIQADNKLRIMKLIDQHIIKGNQSEKDEDAFTSPRKNDY